VVIRRVEPLAAAKVMGLVYAAVGIIVGIIFAAASLLGGLASARPAGVGFGAGFGVAAIIVLPIVYGCIGFIMTAIAAAVYNWAAGIAGGIQIQTE
jgi:hypothetical protein